MMSCKPLRIAQGTTYTQVFRWGVEPLVYKPVSAMVSLTPLTLTATAHGLPANWSVAFANLGFDELKADEWPPDADDFYEATTVDVDTVSFNEIDAGRLTGTYAAGASLVYMTPAPLAGATASFTVYDASGTLVLTVAAVLDDTAKTISVTISDTQTAALDVGSYTYALTATDSGGIVTLLGTGDIDLFKLGAE